jgi:uncharacterized protein
MNRTFKAAVAVLMLAVSFAGPVTAGQLEDAAAAYMKGDYVKATRLLRPLAEQGNADAQAHLTFLYANGEGVPQDYETALGWYRKAAEQGNAIAQYNLGDMYRVGEGVPADNSAAASWYRKAAEQGYTPAQNNLGVMYDNGEGVGQDDVSAHMWFSLAAANGFKEAVRNRNMVARHMTPEQLAEAQKLAREWKPTSTPPPR